MAGGRLETLDLVPVCILNCFTKGTLSSPIHCINLDSACPSHFYCHCQSKILGVSQNSDSPQIHYSALKILRVLHKGLRVTQEPLCMWVYEILLGAVLFTAPFSCPSQCLPIVFTSFRWLYSTIISHTKAPILDLTQGRSALVELLNAILVVSLFWKNKH